MKNNITIIILSLIIGSITGILIYKAVAPKPINTTTEFMEKLKIKELHMIKHIYQDLAFIHRKNDPDKNLKAVATIPVSLSSFINLSNIKTIKKGDTINEIIIPQPEITEPNYFIDKMEVKKIKSFQIHIGRDLHSEVLKYMKDLITVRKEAIIKLAIENKITEETKSGALDYVKSLLMAFNMNNVSISFAKGDEKDDLNNSLIQKSSSLKTTLNSATDNYLPEQIGVVNIK